MLISLLQRLAADIRRAVSTVDRTSSHRSLSAMLMLDDHLLRDIGLTRADVIECLSTPADDDSVAFLDARRKRNASGKVPPQPAEHRCAA
jgi:uncharacterized protein YjiS (DUF1127 family)